MKEVPSDSQCKIREKKIINREEEERDYYEKVERRK